LELGSVLADTRPITRLRRAAPSPPPAGWPPAGTQIDRPNAAQDQRPTAEAGEIEPVAHQQKAEERREHRSAERIIAASAASA